MKNPGEIYATLGVTDLLVGKTPQPARLALHAPAGLIGVQMGRLLRLAADLFVPGLEHLRQPAPGVDQTARRQLGLQVIAKDVNDVVDGDAKPIVKPTGQRDQVMPERRAGQRIGHDRLDVLLALRAVVAMDHVLGDDRLDFRGDVFDHARTCSPAALELSAATGTTLQTMGFLLVDPLGRPAPTTRMPFASPRLLTPPGRVGLGVDRPHARGRRRRWRLCSGLPLQPRDHCLLLGDALAGGQQREHDGFAALPAQPSSLCFGKRASQRSLDQRVRRHHTRRPWPHAGGYTSAQDSARVYLS